ncbi:magnesium-translocating P-type ATPase [Pedococcus sp. KACC 23699]|uniref:Magnesium-transporting ATPase, P-type 1 n=1 Tax=Pedococcus sp. KACC 23699 TaxID=3149228 RepID=A0AAU7JQ10_9MICO
MAVATPSSSIAVAAGSQSVKDVAAAQGVSVDHGLSSVDAAGRRQTWGPNAIATHRVNALAVLGRQLRSPLLGLLAVAAAVSFSVGERSDAVIIGTILGASVCLGFVNEYRAERAAAALHDQIHHRSLVRRDGRRQQVDVLDLVPGDLVDLGVGDVVPCDLRLSRVEGLECDESILTGESVPVEKDTDPVPRGTPLGELRGVALMGTIVHAGQGTGIAVATGMSTEFGRIAAGLSARELETGFQRGLRQFSLLLVYVAGVLTTSIFVINIALQRSLLDSLLFSLAIAVGITPQLLPAVVSTSLAAGSRRMRQQRVLVKRLVCIEDLGDVDVLFTDKTGTLTDGRITFARAIPADAGRALDVLQWGLLCTDLEGAGTAAGNPLDAALWSAPAVGGCQQWLGRWTRILTAPFNHESRLTSVVVRDLEGHQVEVVKGAPEAVLRRCTDVPAACTRALEAEFAAGNRVVAVGTRPVPVGAPPPPDEAAPGPLRLSGLLVFLDPPKLGAQTSLARLRALGVVVKIVTGDNAVVAAKVASDLGLVGMEDTGVVDGAELDDLDDRALAARLGSTAVFARVSPEQKARIVRAQRTQAGGVAFLGDGVNDALALHAADVGISVESGTDVAKDAADVILLEKDLDVLADGVVEGRRIFANTIKYVLMGTSSNFGNMFSAAGASLFLSFLPMLPSQILLNNLLYDTSQLAIPTDGVDEEQLRRPSHWDISFIRRFMVVFGPLSSIFDFATFWVMLQVFHSGPAQFRSGWFVESLATQTLIVFSIRTRRVPFLRSTPSAALVVAAVGVVLTGAALPATGLAPALGFEPLPTDFFLALVGMIVTYLVVVEVAKTWFYRLAVSQPAVRPVPPHPHARRLHRRGRRFTTSERVRPAVPLRGSDPKPPS